MLFPFFSGGGGGGGDGQCFSSMDNLPLPGFLGFESCRGLKLASEAAACCIGVCEQPLNLCLGSRQGLSSCPKLVAPQAAECSESSWRAEATSLGQRGAAPELQQLGAGWCWKVCSWSEAGYTSEAWGPRLLSLVPTEYISLLEHGYFTGPVPGFSLWDQPKAKRGQKSWIWAFFSPHISFQCGSKEHCAQFGSSNLELEVFIFRLKVLLTWYLLFF